jgi:hypothetical protein
MHASRLAREMEGEDADIDWSSWVTFMVEKPLASSASADPGNAHFDSSSDGLESDVSGTVTVRRSMRETEKRK